uniref:O-acyl-ADP-ribose deacylase 1 n=1 Tax=Hucho hucho TaxID=62062 RepID=A0A4W5PIX1_9TELE
MLGRIAVTQRGSRLLADNAHIFVKFKAKLNDFDASSFTCRIMSTVSEEPVSSIDKYKNAEGGWSLRHVKGDLFSCPEDEVLAHCISEDCRMGAGIAVKFKNKFSGVDELKKQKKVPGQCAVLKRNKRFVYYLITKEKYSHKPTYDNLRQSLEDMKSHCLQNGVTRISMPRIGCGLDRLSWDKVEEMLEQVFQPTDISITVYTLPVKPTGKTTIDVFCK